MPEVPSQEILSNHGLAVWIASIFVAGAVTLIGLMFRHMLKRIEELERFQRETLTHLVEESIQAHQQSTAALRELRQEIHEQARG